MGIEPTAKALPELGTSGFVRVLTPSVISLAVRGATQGCVGIHRGRNPALRAFQL
jgi:hypothetical protein